MFAALALIDQLIDSWLPAAPSRFWSFCFYHSLLIFCALDHERCYIFNKVDFIDVLCL